MTIYAQNDTTSYPSEWSVNPHRPAPGTALLSRPSPGRVRGTYAVAAAGGATTLMLIVSKFRAWRSD